MIFKDKFVLYEKDGRYSNSLNLNSEKVKL